MPELIPLRSGPAAFRQRTSLDGVTYELTFRWNERESAWYLAIADSAGETIRSCISLVLRWPLLRQVVGSSRPPGELYAIDLDATGAEAGLTDLGGRVRLYYLTAAERAVLEG